MKIIKARHLGMCFGVRDAIALASREASKKPITILGDLVHNETVVNELRSKGIRFEREPEKVATRHVMITAHGASDKMINATKHRGLQVSQATCPLVHHAHRSLARLVKNGFHPVIIGKRDHVEVRGMTEDLESFDVVLTPEDIDALPSLERIGVVSQTTQPIERVNQLLAHLHERFSDAEIKFIDTVCGPTKQRQESAVEIARKADAVIVVGGANSNNTRELAETCGRHCKCVHHVQTAQELQIEWFETAETVGITAGTSTPDVIINAVESRIRQLVEERQKGSLESTKARNSSLQAVSN